MYVRAAEERDVPVLVDFGEKLTQESERFKSQGFDTKRATQVFEKLIDEYGSIFVVLDNEFEVVGTLIGAIDIDWRTGHKVAYEHGLYVLPEYRKSGAASDLIKAFVLWSEMHSADRISVGTITGIHADKTVKLYESHGFELTGYVLEKDI
ncbi:GNAT family N-acetyltransferase [Acinetobacter sp. Ver3]|uniref:GNAT family N-acetyltransferase n=1 Tax=Acinetobacter sp. Ver3 TaxID=466088 RepID=UPI00044BDB1B|nr:GNAT family N-acetyltransferase [Acinetobacter sp. Ver3]EZQ12077.1 acetyltransferase [Acinetobacter sp. Ver3]